MKFWKAPNGRPDLLVDEIDNRIDLDAVAEAARTGKPVDRNGLRHYPPGDDGLPVIGPLPDDTLWAVRVLRLVGGLRENLGEAEITDRSPTRVEIKIPVTGPGAVQAEALNRYGDVLFIWDDLPPNLTAGDTVRITLDLHSGASAREVRSPAPAADMGDQPAEVAPWMIAEAVGEAPGGSDYTYEGWQRQRARRRAHEQEPGEPWHGIPVRIDPSMPPGGIRLENPQGDPDRLPRVEARMNELIARAATSLGQDAVLAALRRDVCPDCGHLGLRGGPRGGAGQNLFCDGCGAGFNVAWPRHVVFVQRLPKR